MSDEDKALVEQLYDQADRRHGSVGALHSLEWKAADRIEAQAAEIEKLREALALCAKHVDWMPHPHCIEVETAIRAALEAPHEPA